MPIFEYKCDKCDKLTDKLVSRVDADTDKTFVCDCDKSGTLTRTEAPSAAILRFKGNWFGTTGQY